jgi:DNA-binding NtrC family response regulator
MECLRVLVVDDEEEFVSTLVERMQLRAIDAEGVTRGADALELLTKREFDVILLDVKMPGIGGLEVIKRIKRDHPQTQVILLTGHGSAEAVQEGMGAGAFEYLMKPVDIEDLIRLCKKAAGQ